MVICSLIFHLQKIRFIDLSVGVQVVFYGSCALYLWRQRKERAYALWMLAYITALITVETIFVAVQARTVQLAYVDNRNYPGGPWAWFLASQSITVNVMYEATLFILTFLADLLVVSIH